MKVILETPRLFLREIDVSDQRFLAEVLSDPEVMRYWPAPYSREEAGEWIEKQMKRYERDGCGYWLAIEKTSDQPVGQAGVMMTPIDAVEEAALGWIMHRPFWRRGFAFEAAQGCIDHVFRTMKREKVFSMIRPENLPSVQLALKLGMGPGRRMQHAGLEHVIFTRSRSTGDEA